MRALATGIGNVAGAVGQAMSMSIQPKASGRLDRIIASGDTGAVITSAMAGESPIVIDPIDCATLATSAYHGPTFDRADIQAGVPITVNYTAGSTTTALRLTFTGE